MSYDPGLVARIADALEQLGETTVRQRHVFGGWGFLLGKHTFAIAWGDGVIVKLTPDDYARALTGPGITPFAPDGDRPMGRWAVVDAEVVAEDPELVEWLRRALKGVRE